MSASLWRVATSPIAALMRHYALRQCVRRRAAKRWQHEVLVAKLTAHASSDFGRRFNFAAIRNVDDYRRAVPLVNYAAHAPWLNQVFEGKEGALFRPGTKLVGFSMSSGTTGPRKFIPVTTMAAKELAQSWLLWGSFMYTDHPEVIGTPLAQFASDFGSQLSPTGLPCGDMSGLLVRLQPWIVRLGYSVPYAASQIHDEVTRYYAYLRLTIAQPQIRFIATATPATLIRLAEMADEMKATLIRDLYDGTILGKPKIPATVPAVLQRGLTTRHKARARQLERLADKPSPLQPAAYWRELALIATWTSGNFAHYGAKLQRWFGDVPRRDIGLMASEGHFTLPTADATAAGLLNVDQHFFEFVPEHTRVGPDTQTLLCHELEIGKTYSLVVTTSGGLYRYDMEDLVRCTGYEGEAPSLTFLTKAAHISDLTGEKLSANHIAEALRLVQESLSCELPMVLIRPVTPQGNAPLGYEVLYERTHLPAGLSGDLLQRELERAMATVNYIYGEHRRAGKLAGLVASQVQAGQLLTLQREAGGSHGSPEQAKLILLIPPAAG